MKHVCVVRLAQPPNMYATELWVAVCSCGWVSEPQSMHGAGNAKTNHSKEA